MSDLTVTFGGRSVVLKKVGEFYYGKSFGLEERSRYLALRWKCFLQMYGADASVFTAYGSTAQSAVSAVESKLRSLRDEIDRVLGDG